MFNTESVVQLDKSISKMVAKALNQSANNNLHSKKPYIVISAVQSIELENKVAVAIQQGYYAQGGLSVSEGIYYQAMLLVQ